MQTTQEVTVAEIAAASLNAVRVFERLGIDYCCGGKSPLADVCRQKGLDLATVEAELASAASATSEPERDWNAAPLRELVSHIVSRHHAYLRRELGPLQARLETVYRVYNERYGETLPGLPETFSALRTELESHIGKEEVILFPAIEAIETAVASGLSSAAAGIIGGPIHCMEAEHENAGAALARIRAITADFAIPDYACVTFRSLMAGLQELEQDLRLHIHLENNILFPRAQALAAGKN